MGKYIIIDDPMPFLSRRGRRGRSLGDLYIRDNDLGILVGIVTDSNKLLPLGYGPSHNLYNPPPCECEYSCDLIGNTDYPYYIKRSIYVYTPLDPYFNINAFSMIYLLDMDRLKIWESI